MLPDKKDVWADLIYVLDELERSPHDFDIHDRLTDAADLDEQSFEEFNLRLLLIAEFSAAYRKAKARADVKNAHEAIEKGLKAILRDSGLSESWVRSRRHKLHPLLLDVQQHNPVAFGELERCFDSAIRYLEAVTTIQHTTNIVDYFQEYGEAEIFETHRYASIEGDKGKYGMIGFIYQEMIRALLSLIFGWTPRDIDSRIEEAAKKAILAESGLDPVWDAAGWINQGPVRPRLEAVGGLNSKVLLAAVRRSARESKSSGVRFWAQTLRRNRIAARRKARAGRRIA